MSKPFALLMTIIILTATAAVALGGLKSTQKTQTTVIEGVQEKADRLLN